METFSSVLALLILNAAVLLVFFLSHGQDKGRTLFETNHTIALLGKKLPNNMWYLLAPPFLILLFGGDHGLLYFSGLLLPLVMVPIWWVAIAEIRDYADIEKGKALSTKPERTDEYRRKYIALHREQILKNAEQIKENHEKLFSKLKRVEYFRTYVSPEVVAMWEEDRLRWRMVVEGKDQPAPINKDDIFESEDKAAVAKREMDSILRAFEFEKMTLESMKTNLAKTEKAWTIKYGPEEAKAMIEQLKQRINQFMNREL